MAILLQGLKPGGVTFCQLAPASRVRCTRPVSVPAQISFVCSGDGAMLYTTPKPRCIALSLVVGPVDLAADVPGTAPVKSGLISCQCRPPSTVFITHCVPK